MAKTILYFVRHAESLYIENKERERGLSNKGIIDSKKVSTILSNVKIDAFISSPYERAIQTIQPLAESYGQEIILQENLRERKIGNIKNLSFSEAKKRVYEDFSWAFPDGESSEVAQGRSVQELKQIIRDYCGKTIVIGTHGDIMTLMLNYFDKQYGYDFWESTSMPDIYKLELNRDALMSVERLWG